MELIRLLTSTENKLNIYAEAQKHTHFAAPQANTPAKAAKRVCFSSAREKL